MRQARWLAAALVLAAGCDSGPTGVPVGFTDPPVGTTPGTGLGRAIILRGTVTATPGQSVAGTVVRVRAVAVDGQGECTGAATTVDRTTTGTGEFRSEVRVGQDVVTLCVTVTATPPAGSALRGGVVDVGRLSPALDSGAGTPLPERIVNVALTT